MDFLRTGDSYSYRRAIGDRNSLHVRTHDKRARTWTDTGRLAEQTYWYRVRAVTDAALGVLSTKDCSESYPSFEGVC